MHIVQPLHGGGGQTEAPGLPAHSQGSLGSCHARGICSRVFLNLFTRVAYKLWIREHQDNLRTTRDMSSSLCNENPKNRSSKSLTNSPRKGRWHIPSIIEVILFLFVNFYEDDMSSFISK
jgi:hypothetical protein